MPVEQSPAPAAPETKSEPKPSFSASAAAQKVSALLDGDVDPVTPSGIVQMEAPAGLANMGERLVGQTKGANKWRMSTGDDVASDRHMLRAKPALADFHAQGEYFAHHPAAFHGASSIAYYVANKVVGDSRIPRDTPLNHIDLYSAYKNTPHAPASMFLKYLVHRINHVEDYEDHAKGHALDIAFQGLVTKGGAAEKNGHVSLQDLHDWTNRHATTVVPQLLAEKQRMQMDVARGVGLNVRSINGEPYVALTRGLNSDIMEDEHPLSSHADKPDTGFGSTMHHSWVPLKDLWFAYDLDRTKRSGNNMGAEDEYLISNTGTRYEAQPHDIKKSRIKNWDEKAPYIYDDMSDETLAAILAKKNSNPDVFYGAKFHQNAGPAVYATMRKLWADPMGGHFIPAGKPPIGSFGFKWYPREEVMKAAANPTTVVDTPAWFRNPNLTSQDLEVLGSKLLRKEPHSSVIVEEAADELLDHPAMNSHLLEKLWRSQHNSPWAVRLLKSPLATHQMREDAIEVAKFNTPSPSTYSPYATKLMRAVVANPHHTEKQAREVYDLAVTQGLFSHNEDLTNVLRGARVPLDVMLKVYERADELLRQRDDEVRAAGSGFVRPPPPEAATLRALKTDLVASHPRADYIAQVAASKPGRVEPRSLLNRMSSKDGILEPELQAALINECAHPYGKGIPQVGSTRQPVNDYLEKLAGAKGLSQESISYLAHYNDDDVRDALFRNKSVTPEQLREAYPKSEPFLEEAAVAHIPPHYLELKAGLAAAYYRRLKHSEAKSTKHFIKPLPQDLAKSSNEDMWLASARSWLAQQGTTGFYLIAPKEMADNIIRDKGIEPQFTEELLEGEAIFARPASPVNLDKLQQAAGPDDVVLFFETEVEPQQHTDGSVYWTSRVPCETVHIVDVGHDPLAKMHTALTFPKLGVSDDRRETKIVSNPRERKTFMRAAAVQGVREAYVTHDTDEGDINEQFAADPALRTQHINEDAKKANKLDSVGVMWSGVAGVGHPGHGVEKEQRKLIPGAGTGISALSAAFTPSSTPRRKFGPAEMRVHNDPQSLPTTVRHEDLHRIFARIQHKHGEAGRAMLARNLIFALPQDLQSAVMKHLFWVQPDEAIADDPEEEAITELGSYLNQSQQRDAFHKKQQHSPEQHRAFHDKMKRAYRLLQAVSATADENWLYHLRPWTKVALKKFHEPQSGTGLSAAEAHAVFKGSLKLSKSNPDLMDPNAFALKFETDPTFMEAIDARNWELELRKSNGPQFPKAATNFVEEFEKRTADNGFDWRLGRYHNTTGKNDEGTLIVVTPRIAEWHGENTPPVVGLDWIQALKPGNGDGHRSMKFLTELADKHGVSMELHVGSDGGVKTSPKSMLHKFYKKHGFTPRGKFEKDILVRRPAAPHVTTQGETLKLGSAMRTVKKAEDDVHITLPHESVLKPGEESAAKAFLGHNKVHETALAAARFLVGRKEPVDEDMFRLALNVYDGDVESAALIAVGLTNSEANLKALRAVLKLGEFSPDELSKNEPGTPHIESVNPGAPDASDTADEVKRGATAGLVQPLKLGGKHSKGSMAIRDPKTGNTWLLKPGAGKASPAAGVRDGASSQSAREAAFWHCMDRTGLGNYGPKCDLLEVNGGQVAAMKLLGTSWKSADEQNRKVDGWAREILQPYLDRGDVHRIAALFWALGESDAHGQNVLVHAEAIALIDHGSSFAGPNFNPGRDSKSFTPYILRVFAPAGYTKKKPEDRIDGLPKLTPAGDSALKKWVQSIDPALISETMGSHGIGNVEQEAVLERLSDLQHFTGPSLSRYVNELWAGVVLPPHLRSQP